MAPPDSSRPAPAPSSVTGLALMALSATSYGAIPVFARLAFEAGATPLTLLSLRYLAAVAVLGVGLRIAGRPWRLPPGRRLAGVVTGLLFSIMAYTYLAAIRVIPVSSAVLLFFTYPVLVTLVGWARGYGLGLRRALAVLAAFIGLALALGVEIAELDPVGVALASLGSLTYTFGIFYFGRATTGTDPMTVSFQAMATCAAVFAPLALIRGEILPPDSTLGLLGALGVVVTYFVGLVAFFGALPRIGPIKTALLSQLEPVVSILAAVIVLREELGAVQSTGIALVLGALLLLAR
ncbi:MAG TPA: DMT family transporter [Stellaceae bacterium]|nr:DMT family transporter [Stellaceae bacterium]